jgi:hypothetical protein
MTSSLNVNNAQCTCHGCDMGLSMYCDVIDVINTGEHKQLQFNANHIFYVSWSLARSLPIYYCRWYECASWINARLSLLAPWLREICTAESFGEGFILHWVEWAHTNTHNPVRTFNWQVMAGKAGWLVRMPEVIKVLGELGRSLLKRVFFTWYVLYRCRRSIIYPTVIIRSVSPLESRLVK